jgi:uncharacterized RDD family membrane protein YckC
MTYFNPEQQDDSEQQFAISLEQKADRPAFEIELNQSPPVDTTSKDTEADGSNSSESIPEIPGLENTPPEEARQTGDIAAETAEAEMRVAGENWRDLVSAKVDSYKSRRPRKERYPSLQLHFEAKPFNRQRTPREPLDFNPLPEIPRSDAEPAQSYGSNTRSPIILETTARVLEFPRPASHEPRVDELAEPVISVPRIVEAPELLPPPPAMGGILIEAPEQERPERRLGFDLPLQSASLQRRGLAGVADGLLVICGTALFGYIALRIIGSALPWQRKAQVAAAFSALLWPVYQYVFLVFCGKSPGLLLARLEIKRFDGSLSTRSLRCWRVLASFLSAASLGLGYLWCFLDEDRLSWHDRITKTHLAPRPPAI